jgi:arginyl-tRNA synthetase
VELAGPGFINIFLNREAFLNQLDGAHNNPNFFVDSTHAPKKKYR